MDSLASGLLIFGIMAFWSAWGLLGWLIHKPYYIRHFWLEWYNDPSPMAWFTVIATTGPLEFFAAMHDKFKMRGTK